MTKESWNQYQNAYRKSHYKQLSAHLNAEYVDDFKKLLKQEGITFNTFLRTAIDEFIKKVDK